MNRRLVIALSLLLLGGCASAPTIQSPLAPVVYAPMPSTVHIAGSATIDATYDPAPEILARWKRDGFDDDVIARHRQDVTRALVNDLAGSGLFNRVLPASAGFRPDHVARIHCRTFEAPGYAAIRVSIEAVSGATGRQEWELSSETGLGPVQGPHRPLSQVLPEIMAHLRSNLANSMATKAREDAEQAEIAGLKTASLANLLVSSDRNTSIARERNRALIAAKNQQLPDLLRNWKTDELSSLVVRIEQTILDLNHECEVAKDKAQQSVAEGSAADGGTGVQRARMDALSAGSRQTPVQGFLGINMADAGDGNGVVVEGVVSGGPAEQAGLKPSDVILAANDQPLANTQALQSYVGQTAPGSSLPIRLRRNGEEQVFTVVVGRRPGSAPNSLEALRDLAISYRERIELLKPIAAAVKEEIANRNR